MTRWLLILAVALSSHGDVVLVEYVGVDQGLGSLFCSLQCRSAF